MIPALVCCGFGGLGASGSSLGRDRRPIRWVRRLVAVAVLILLAGGYLAYRHLTSPECIRACAEDYLAEWTRADVSIASARFGLFDGLRLKNVRIAVPASAAPAAPACSQPDRTVFFAPELHLRHELLALLTGRLVISQIVAVEPTFRIVKDPRDGRFNWQRLFGGPRRRTGSTMRPRIRLRDARVILSRADAPSQAKTLVLSVLGEPEATRPDVYRFDWAQRSREGRRGRMLVDLSTLRIQAVEGGLPAMPVEAALLVVPERLAAVERWLALLGLTGQMTAEDFVLDPKHRSQITLNLRDVSLSIPLDSREASAPPEQRFLRFEQVGGAIRYDGQSLALDLGGRFHTGRFRIVGSSTGKLSAASSIGDVGFALRVTCHSLRLPEYDHVAHPAEARFIERWGKLRAFFRDFDPHGVVDLELRLVKAEGREYGVVLDTGTLIPRGANACYRRFAYRLDELSGRVEFTRRGVVLNNLTGRHGPARVTINGRIHELNRQTPVELEIEAADVPLDESLYRALPERYQRVWRQFTPSGRANVFVRLDRGPGSDDRAAPWQTIVVAGLRDVRARYVRVPYPIERIHGQLRIGPSGMEIEQLRGRNGQASIVIDGTARWDDAGRLGLDLTLEADDLPVDDELAAALPPQVGQILGSFQVDGSVKLSGRIFREPEASDTDYEMRLWLDDLTLRHRALPWPITDVTGLITIDPEQLTVIDVQGWRDQTAVNVSGTVRWRRQPPQARIVLTTGQFDLDQALRDALPERFRQAWSLLQPKGKISLTTRIEYPGPGGVPRPTHQTVIEALGDEVTYAKFPLALQDVRGRIVLTDRQIRLEEITARHGQAELNLDGRFDLAGPDRQATLRIEARNMTFGQALYEALPWRMRRVWRACQPEGTFDLLLDRLTYRRLGDQSPEWRFDGCLSMRDGRLKIGLPCTHLTGSIRGTGQARGRGEGFGIDARLQVASATVRGYDLRNVSARLRKPASSSLVTLDDFSAQAYGGMILGSCQVVFGRRGTKYALTLVADDIELASFLNATRKGQPKRTDLAGRVRANLFLSGTVGDLSSRRGGGQIRIDRARMARLPLILSVLRAANLTEQDGSSAQDAAFEFYLIADRLKFEQITLRGPGFRILGAGWVYTPTRQMDLTLVAGHPEAWPEVPFLSELLEGAAGELVQVSLTGTPDHPSFRVRSLRGTRRR